MPDRTKISRTDEEWQSVLTPEQYRVMREGGTEAPFSGKYWNEEGSGVYKCAACGAELFSSAAKLSSSDSSDPLAGWPGFREPRNRENVTFHDDASHGMHRTEVRCRRCGAHLGHVFDGVGSEKHFCINSTCLELERNS